MPQEEGKLCYAKKKHLKRFSVTLNRVAQQYGDDISDVSAEQIYGKRKLRKLQQLAARCSQGRGSFPAVCIGCRRDLCIRMWHLNLINVQRRDGKWILRRILNYAPHVNRSVARNQPIPFCRATGARELQLQLPLQLQLRPQVALKGTVQLAGQWIACKVE